MKFLFWILIIVGLVVLGNVVLDFFGYYIEWKWAAIGISGALPVIQGFRMFLRSDQQELRDFKAQMNTKQNNQIN